MVDKKQKQKQKQKQNNFRPGEWLNLMVSEPYYLSHFIAFFSYFVIRSSATRILSYNITHLLLCRELQAILVFLIFYMFKMVRQETPEAFIADMLLFVKVFLVALTSMMDYHLAIWYVIVFTGIYVFTQQPVFQGSGTCSKLTPLQLETLLTEGNKSRLWLVEFRVSFSADCIRSSRCLPDLSVTYSNKHLSFGVVDLGLFPNVAEKFGISLGGSMNQLPSYILFENAAEVARLPDLDFELKAYPPITKRLLCRHFDLDRRLLEYVYKK
ncbi:thioredoxin-related transmembrane protein 2 isoform X2 [Momordica charantia]|uniref:Thioredoxin-related transmembrane protein 2 isoform X2 n=1 Tax=Momordica charantia TaxID=3673 RepID=A0A6J1DXS7_MOMCH|nr:thioredoxin-related transmembrane protein 2 isoform X2 [Momordica charantia]